MYDALPLFGVHKEARNVWQLNGKSEKDYNIIWNISLRLIEIYDSLKFFFFCARLKSALGARYLSYVRVFYFFFVKRVKTNCRNHDRKLLQSTALYTLPDLKYTERVGGLLRTYNTQAATPRAVKHLHSQWCGWSGKQGKEQQKFFFLFFLFSKEQAMFSVFLLTLCEFFIITSLMR